MDNLAQTESIIDLVKGVKKEIIVLPEFQRDFVWDVGKTYDLFDSLVKNIFIGSIIYGVPSFEITTREIDERPRKGEGSRKKLKLKSYSRAEIEQKIQIGKFRLLLDGQQRITSLIRAIKGVDVVWFIARDLEDANFAKSELEELLYEFAGQESENRLSVRVSDAFKIMQNDYFEDEIRDNFFEGLKYHKDFTESHKKGVFRNYLTIVRKLQDMFKSEKMLSYYLLDTTLEKFALFFERSNSRGIQLNFIDILAAKLYDGFNLRENITEFEDKYGNYKLNREIIVRAIAFIITDGKEIDRAGILKKLTAEHFSEHWDSVCNRYKKSLDFLYKNHIIISQSWMPYENMLIPLMMFLKEIGDDFSNMSEKQFRFIKFWYWASVFAQRYTAASNDTIIQDSLILMRIAKKGKITDRNYFYKLRNQITSADELHSFTKKGSAVYKGILNLINYNAGGLIDWTNKGKLSFNSRLDDHHIFPKKYLSSTCSKNEELLSLTDSVVNRTLIPKITNIKIGKKAPAEYLNNLRKMNSNLRDSLENHLIPPELIDGMYDDDYSAFLETRGKAIYQLIELNITGKSEEIRTEFYQEPEITEAKNKIKVFASYYSRKIYADFYPETSEVFYQGKTYSTPSGAAIAAKKDISGKDITANGWEFWKFTDEQGQEKSISELRQIDDEH
jgi:hypothetical protein